MSRFTEKRFSMVEVVVYAGLAAAALGFGGYVLLQSFLLAPGDEPPIRVRNGSYHFDSKGSEWVDGDPDGSDPSWAIAYGNNGGVYTVKIESKNLAGCAEAEPIYEVMKVEMTTAATPPRKFRLQAGKHGHTTRTKVAPGGLLNREPDRGTLSAADGTDSIKEIKFVVKGGGVRTCTVANGNKDNLFCIGSGADTPNCGPQ